MSHDARERSSCSQRLTRRAVMLGAATLGALALIRQDGRAQIPSGAIYSGDCRVEPGVELLVGFNLGQPVVSIAELLPPFDWRRYVNIELGLTFLYPPDWSAVTLWAEQFSPGGAPLWSSQPVFLPTLTTNRVIAPDGTASVEAAVGTISGALLSPLQAARIADLGVIGETTRQTPICSYEDPNPLAPAWFRASYIDGYVLISEGFALPNPSAFTPSTIVTYYAMTGRRDAFEALTREVFLRILFQFLPGGGDQPTPTPTE